MRFLILNTDYCEFLRWIYRMRPGLERGSYEEQMRARSDSMFGVADFYSANLRRIGHEAIDVHFNNQAMQAAWAREHGVKLMPRFLQPLDKWLYGILAAQIKYYKPDAIITHDIGLSSRFFREMKPYFQLLIGQYAAPLPRGQDFSVYDLIVSSLPNLVDYFRDKGVKSEFLGLGFEPAVLNRLNNEEKGISVSFVGNLSNFHSSRLRWLTFLCRHVNISIWGPSIKGASKEIKNSYCGPAWGIKMYQILRISKLTLNHHIDVSGPYANNMRLFEATGVGTMLITDWKKNLNDMFEIGREVVAYQTPEECVEKIKYYLENEDKREAIAQAGKRRTLSDYDYYCRMRDLADIVRKYI